MTLHRRPDRRTIRLPGHNYAARAAYFVTICSAERACIFGEVIDAKTSLSDIGTIVDEEWQRTAAQRSNVRLDSYVVMPNHFHGIIYFEAAQVVPTSNQTERANQRFAPTMPRRAGSLGAILAQFKSAVTKRVSALRGEPTMVWQRNYYEHIIRDDADLHRIRQYIEDNPARWAEDPENPANYRPPRS